MISIRGARPGLLTALLSTLATLLLTVGIAASAQGIITGGISGTAVDPAASVIPGAAVTAVSEGIATAYNVLNRAFYGIPDPNVEDSAFGGFMSSQFAYGTNTGSGAGGGAFPQRLGNRNVQLTDRITF